MSDEASVNETGPLAPQALPAAEPGFDFSLRLLTALVLVALAGSVSFLVYRWLAPHFEGGSTGAADTRSRVPTPAATAPEKGPAPVGQVLMAPGRIFKCEKQGQITFSDQNLPDQPCVDGGPVAPAASGTARAPGVGATARAVPDKP